MLLALITPQEAHAARARRGVMSLGASIPGRTVTAGPKADAVWRSFLGTSANELEVANITALSWYATMRAAFETLDVPLLQQTSSAFGMPTAWTQDLEQKLLDLTTMGETVIAWLREAERGDRQLVVQGDTWGLGTAVGDEIHIVINPAKVPPEPMMMAGRPEDAQEAHVGPGSVGEAPVQVGGVKMAWTVTTVSAEGILAIADGVIHVLYTALMLLGQVIQGIVRYWTDKTWADCLARSSDTASCSKAIEALEQYTATVNGLTPDSVLETRASTVAKVAKAALWVGLGVGVLYAGVKLVPPLVERARGALDGGRA